METLTPLSMSLPRGILFLRPCVRNIHKIWLRFLASLLICNIQHKAGCRELKKEIGTSFDPKIILYGWRTKTRSKYPTMVPSYSRLGYIGDAVRAGCNKKSLSVVQNLCTNIDSIPRPKSGLQPRKRDVYIDICLWSTVFQIRGCLLTNGRSDLTGSSKNSEKLFLSVLMFLTAFRVANPISVLRRTSIHYGEN